MTDQHCEPRKADILLACPRCGAALAGSPRPRCNDCSVDFPTFAGVPWLFADPAGALAEWRSRIDHAHARLQRDHELATRSLANCSEANARRRLESLAAGYGAQSRALRELLAPLVAGKVGAALEVHLALKTRLPGAQGLTTYYSNLFRDWSWGDAENDASCAAVLNATGRDTAARLVLGAGACRLAYDLHRASSGGATYALDFNPLSMLAAERIVRGGHVSLTEFPIAPKDLDDVAASRTLAAPAPADENLRLVLADADRPPFRRHAFDCVIAPWFVDVADEALPSLARRINALLAPGGRFVVFGSLAFEHADPARRYSKAEALAHIEAAGFSIALDEEREIPYMNAPGSRHARREIVVTIAARKTRAVDAALHRERLPRWLTDSAQPVPLAPAFQTQAFTTRIYAFLMSMIDGRRSIDDMAALMEQQKLMPKDEARAAVRSFLTKMFEESEAPPGR